MKLNFSAASTCTAFLRHIIMKIAFLVACALSLCAIAHAVEFPGTKPGTARATKAQNTYTLSNNLFSASWQLQNGQLRLTKVGNALNTQKMPTDAREIFRLSSQAAPDATVRDGFRLGWRWDAKFVTAEYNDGEGENWRVLKTFARADFPGAPTILRVGKMNLQGENVDYADAGALGSSRITEIAPALGEPQLLPSARANTKLIFSNNALKIDADANSAAVAEWKLPPNINQVSARIWKDSDKGMSWGPGLALRWPNGKFAIMNARAPLGQFSIATQDGETLLTSLPPAPANYDWPASAFQLVGAPIFQRTKNGQELVANFRHPEKPIMVQWRAILRDGSHYFRQQIALQGLAAGQNAGTLSNVELVNFPVQNTAQIGTVPGSPLAGANWFFGMELPSSANDFSDGARSSVATALPLQTGARYQFASVAGVYPSSQLRRSFLAYLERERARPSKPFLHYNGWYDFAQGVNAKDLSASIAAFHDEMTVKRGVQVDSYVIDDGWDDARNTFWGVDKTKFPNGFAPIAAQLKAIDSHLGIWLSPLGGYGEAGLRTENARKMGLVQDGHSLDLSYAPYYRWFLDEHLKLMRDYQVNYFKWDKAGDGVTPHFLALLRVANQLRRVDPNVYLNVTVGTWPSPFWLNHIDATWRTGSGDMGWIGAGDKREQWLNFRDAQAYERFVKPAPLYPLNSAMHHGISLGRHYQGQEIAVAGPDLKHDARSYFATGATLQELYLTPELMSQDGWDEVAAGAKWSRANFDVLADSHWIGGDPAQGEVYGYASWAPRKGIFMLRNPSDKAGTISLDAAQIFELPAGARRNFRLSSPYDDQRIQSGKLKVGAAMKFELQPFEVLVFEAMPQ